MTLRPNSVTILTQYFYPDFPGTARIATDLAIGLVNRRFSVTVYTGYPSWGSIKNVPCKENYFGVEVNRSYSGLLSRESNTGRLLNGFTVASITLFKILTQKQPDVILVDSTSPFLMTITWILNKLKKIPYVVVVHDVYPDIAIAVGILRKRSTLVQLWRTIYTRIYRSASRVVVLGTHMKQIVLGDILDQSDMESDQITSNRNFQPNLHSNKLIVIPNWADGNAIVPVPSSRNPMRKQLGLLNKLVVTYSGNMGASHDIQTMIGAAIQLKDQQSIQFLFIGEGTQKDAVYDSVRNNQLRNVTLLPYQTQENLVYSLSCGDIALVTLGNGMEGLSVPSKVYSSLAAGLAIAAIMGPNSEIADIVKQYQCGYLVPQGDIDGLVHVIKQVNGDRSLLKRMKTRARTAFDSEYDIGIGITRYSDMLKAVLQQRNG